MSEEEQYALAQAALAAAAAAYAQRVVSLFIQPALSAAEWLALLGLVFPALEQYREQSAALARTFYDQQRARFHPELPRHDVWLEGTGFDTFAASMEPVRKKMMLPQSPKSVVTEFTFSFVREVENAGRHQIVNAVESDSAVLEKISDQNADIIELFRRDRENWLAEQVDDRPTRPAFQDVNRPVRGWARVATGRETCAWCLMLVSRGPVYESAQTAGSKFDDESTVAAYFQGTDVDKFMNKWHIGCDCKVVPVFDLANWPGMDAQKRAEQLWIDAMGDARQYREDNPDRVHLTGKKKGQEFTFNEDVVLALRRRIERGDISSQDWAVLTAA